MILKSPIGLDTAESTTGHPPLFKRIACSSKSCNNKISSLKLIKPPLKIYGWKMNFLLLSLSVSFQRKRIISKFPNHPSFLRGTLVVSFREGNFDVETSRDIVCCMASKKVQLSMATLSGTLQIENSLHQLKAYSSAWNGTSWPFS